MDLIRLEETVRNKPASNALAENIVPTEHSLVSSRRRTGPFASDEGFKDRAAVDLTLAEGSDREVDAAVGSLERSSHHRRVELCAPSVCVCV